jgi:hypothetical protein
LGFRASGAAFHTCLYNSLVYGQASIAISGEIGSDPGQSKTALKGCLPNNYGILRICRQRLWVTLQPPALYWSTIFGSGYPKMYFKRA